MNFFILVGGSSRTTGDLIKPKKSMKKPRKKGEKWGPWGPLRAMRPK